MESRLRLLIIKLEHLDGIKMAHPFVKSIDQVEPKMIKEQDSESLCHTHVSNFYIGLLLDSKSPTSSTTTGSKLDLSQAVSDFVDSVVTWDKKVDSMDIHVKHLKRYIFESIFF